MADSIEDKLLPLNKLRVLRALGWLCMVVLILPFLALSLPKLVGWEENSTSISWVLLLFGGFAFLIVTLLSASVLFRVFEIHDPAHSLALPRNSIRSLLTFLVFMILMTFIFYSTHIVSTTGSDGTAEISKTDFEARVEQLGIEGAITKYTEDGDKVSITYIVEEESPALEYFDRILVALLGISSTIIGFYFGTRSREDAGSEDAGDAGDDSPDAGVLAKTRETETGALDEADGADWTIVSDRLVLTAAADGKLTGEVTIAADALADLGEFAAQFEPTAGHDAATDNAIVKVARTADKLVLTVEGLTADQIRDETRMSVFFRDQEERAQSVPVALG